MYIKCIHIWLIVHFCGPFWWPIPYIIDSRLVPVVWRDFLEIKWSDHQPEEAHGSPKIMGLLLKMTWLSWWVFPWKKQLLEAPLRCTKLLTCSSIPSARKWRTLLMCRGGHFRGCKYYLPPTLAPGQEQNVRSCSAVLIFKQLQTANITFPQATPTGKGSVVTKSSPKIYK